MYVQSILEEERVSFDAKVISIAAGRQATGASIRTCTTMGMNPNKRSLHILAAYPLKVHSWRWTEAASVFVNLVQAHTKGI